MTEAQSMLKSVDIHGGISDLRVPSYSLYQWESSLRIQVSHWTKMQQAVVSAAIVYFQPVSTSEIVCWTKFAWHVSGSEGATTPESYTKIVSMIYTDECKNGV
jgi:hypothetical protein